MKNAWMNREIFLGVVFIPTLKIFRNNERKVGIDVYTIGEDFIVMLLPPNAAALLQQMDQGIVAKCK